MNTKIALVTGASRGIGKAIAEKLSEKYFVIGTATTEKGANDISAYLGDNGCGMMLDLCDIDAIAKTLEKITAQFGNIDILVNNAGITSDNLLMRMHDEQWRQLLNTNLTPLFYLCKAVIKPMMKKRFGRIISIGSVVGSIGNAGQTNYSATKAALIGFSKSLALEVANRGITVNVVAPGFITTDMTSNLTENQKNAILTKIPTASFGKPSDIANAVAFLADEESCYITGQTLHINGGMFMN